MSIIRKTVPYEILLRFDFSNGKTIGQLQGAHFIEGEAVVDEESGQVLAYKPGQAQELPREKAEEYLGKQFAGIHAAMQEAQGSAKQHADRSVELEAQVWALNAKVADLEKRNADLTEQLAVAANSK